MNPTLTPNVALLGGRLQRNLSEIASFLAHPLEEIAIDREIAERYAEIVVALRKAGKPLPSNDIWIAAAAARTGSTVLTYDGHFGFIQRVGSLVLRAGEA